jgi:riboflavin kinase/FMN adenylyltransferase
MVFTKVIEGSKIGRTLGFPTANLEMNSDIEMIDSGVYGVDVLVLGKHYKGVMNIGHRPTINSSKKVAAEIYILDFSNDIYNCEIGFEIKNFIREERAFADKEALKDQIERDIKAIF